MKTSTAIPKASKKVFRESIREAYKKIFGKEIPLTVEREYLAEMIKSYKGEVE